MNRKLSRPGVREGYDLWSESYDQTPNPLIALDRRFTMTLLQPRAAERILDAATSGGGVTSDLPVTVSGKIARDHLKGPVNGGGKPVVLRSSGGSIHVKKL